MPAVILGPRIWSGAVDAEGHRSYVLKVRVAVGPGEGPATALQTPGLPAPGSYWVIDNDIDLYAWCQADRTVTPIVQEGEPQPFFDVELKFSTKPPDRSKQRCQDQKIEDPLLEPPKISGSSSNYQEEVTTDRFGRAILNSGWEQVEGPPVQFDKSRQSIKIQQNVGSPLLGYVLPTQMLNTVNAFPLWGFPYRAVRLSSAPWERQFYGQCSVYYSRTLEFEARTRIDPQTGILIGDWDRDYADKGYHALHGDFFGPGGKWRVTNLDDGTAPNPGNPAHFVLMQDQKYNPVLKPLDGFGKPISDPIGGDIANISQSAPVLYTSNNHGLVTGDIVAISDIRTTGDNAAKPTANGVFVVANPTTNTFQGTGSSNDGGGVSSGGKWRRLNNAQGKIHIEYYPESDFTQLGIPLTF